MNQHSRIPVAHDYVQALGRACYNFAYLEACVIRCIETFEAGYQSAILSQKKTAGQIAFDFLRLTREAPLAKEVFSNMSQAAARFDALVDTRNDLLHGRPRMAADGGQRLYRFAPDGHEVDWTLEDIEEAAEAFEGCAMEVTDILRDDLDELEPDARPARSAQN